jgi:hypothetical protein
MYPRGHRTDATPLLHYLSRRHGTLYTILVTRRAISIIQPPHLDPESPPPLPSPRPHCRQIHSRAFVLSEQSTQNTERQFIKRQRHVSINELHAAVQTALKAIDWNSRRISGTSCTFERQATNDLCWATAHYELLDLEGLLFNGTKPNE